MQTVGFGDGCHWCADCSMRSKKRAAVYTFDEVQMREVASISSKRVIIFIMIE